MKLKIYSRNGYSDKSWASDGDEKLKFEINIYFYFGLTFLPFFCVTVLNKSFCRFNLFSCLIDALESETVGMQKYTALKTRVRDIGAWQKL